MASRVTNPPQVEPVSLDDAKNHLKVDFSTDDTLIEVLITAAREVAEDYTNQKFITQTIEETFNSFPSSTPLSPYCELQLAFGPLIQVVSIRSLNSEGTYDEAIDQENYTASDTITPPVVIPKLDYSWPTTVDHPEAVKVVYHAGFGAAATDVPKGIKQAMLLMIGYWYENRIDSVRKMPTQAEWLLRRYRIQTIH
ncbi:MAG: head-tail connector protein [Bacteroidota bacterium]